MGCSVSCSAFASVSEGKMENDMQTLRTYSQHFCVPTCALNFLPSCFGSIINVPLFCLSFKNSFKYTLHASTTTSINTSIMEKHFFFESWDLRNGREWGACLNPSPFHHFSKLLSPGGISRHRYLSRPVSQTPQIIES